MLIISYSSEYFDERTWHLTIGHVWEIPFLAYMVQMNLHKSNRWTYWACSTLLIAHPSAGPLLHGWVSRNSNAVRTRAVGAAVFSMFFQLSGIVSANIYQKGEWSMRLVPSAAINHVDIDELPNFHTGNKILLGIAILNAFTYTGTKIYYVWRNRIREKKWQAMSEKEQETYLKTTKDKGNKRLDFRLAH